MKKMMILFSLLSLFVVAQATKEITGTVYDETNVPIPGVSIVEKGTLNSVLTDMQGNYKINVVGNQSVLVFSFIGYENQEIAVEEKMQLVVHLIPDQVSMDEVVVVGYGVQKKQDVTGSVSTAIYGSRSKRQKQSALAGQTPGIRIRGNSSYQKAYCVPPCVPVNNEDYAGFSENKFLDPNENPLSTFSVDVDRASYTNIRRYINNGSLPPADAVRIEEMINYFTYDYDEPRDEHPFAIHHELATCAWNKEHYLMKVALQGKKIDREELPPSNLVFLLDVSGSMGAHNKLPLLKSALKLLVNELREEDKVSIVVYAGAAGVVLEPTSGNNKRKIVEALNQLSAGGSTAGGAGLRLAYKLAHENFVKDGNNRIVLATDGDFNVGISSNDEMEKLIEAERNKGIYITVAGFGMGNYKDSKMEIIADKGNGNYFYIDNIQEARKAMVEEFGGTLYTIAKDVKFQLEFNPALVAGYRLIGYENRLLAKEDFNNDKKDAGEIGSGHTVTALYEIIPVGAKDAVSYLPSVDELKYQPNKSKKERTKPSSKFSNELLTLKLRYKMPDADKSNLLVRTVNHKVKELSETSDDFRFASSVTAWGMLLRNSEYIEDVTYTDVIKWAKKARSNDEQGYRAEMIRLMESAQSMSSMLGVHVE
ncbi:DUF3520 domain-containing protein [Labilibacter sediminis]|nr:DUF3520 domain-containing protein [Labilibacter sediminis]